MKTIIAILCVWFMCSFEVNSCEFLVLKNKEEYQVFDFMKNTIVCSFDSVDKNVFFSKAYKTGENYYLQTSNRTISDLFVNNNPKVVHYNN